MNEDQYRAALKELDDLIDIENRSAEQTYRLIVLADMINLYESEHFPLDDDEVTCLFDPDEKYRP